MQEVLMYVLPFLAIMIVSIFAIVNFAMQEQERIMCSYFDEKFERLQVNQSHNSSQIQNLNSEITRNFSEIKRELKQLSEITQRHEVEISTLKIRVATIENEIKNKAA